MCVFAVTFTNKMDWRITIQVKNPNWFGLAEKASEEMAKIEDHKRFGPWTYARANRVA